MRTVAVLVLVAAGLAAPHVPAQSPWLPDGALTAPDAAQDDGFGAALALSGDVVLVGVPADDDQGFDSGAAWVWRRVGGRWTAEQELLPSDGFTSGHFGSAVDLEGDRAVVASPTRDRVYVFERAAGVWTERAILQASDGASGDDFGASVSLSGDRLLVGAPRHTDLGALSGAAYVFRSVSGTWQEEQELLASNGSFNDRFGEAVALDGDRALVGAPRAGDDLRGAVYAFERGRTGWSEVQTLFPAEGGALDVFGTAVALDGDRALVGAPREDAPVLDSGAVSAYRHDGVAWVLGQTLVDPAGSEKDHFGETLALDGDRALVGAHWDDGAAPDGGAAHVFRHVAGAWVHEQTLLRETGAANDEFGGALALRGATAFVGATRADAVFTDQGLVEVFVRPTDPWLDLGGGAPGLVGGPSLAADGALLAGTTLDLALTAAPPDALTLVWLAFTSAPLAALGGTVHAFPPAVQVFRLADAGGAWSESIVWPAGVPSATDLYLQVLVQDGSVPDGITLSGAVVATTP